MKRSAITLSIIIVNYNAGEYLLECLRSLEKAKSEIDFDIWVVDNASEDQSIKIARKEFPQVNYIQNKANLGFGKANNIAIKQTESEFILLLNPDSEIKPGTLIYTLDYLKNHPEVGAISCKVEKEDGTIDWASHRGFPTPWASFLYFMIGDDKLYHLTDRSMDKPHEVDAIAGAFFLSKREILEKVGLFDEDYFLYAEDIDLCYRIKRAGFKIMYLPAVKVIHHKGISSGIKQHSQEVSAASMKSRKRALDSFYETMLIFYKKHLASEYPFFINWLVYLGITIKWKFAKRSLNV